ncbi:MAG TPA: lysophospholipid acyltransferase family protein [Acidobacteriaceae bacterium]|jgi:1-acyl-sn-glycerol-3-phosphate acyltransferase
MSTLAYRNPLRSGLRTALMGVSLAEVAASFASRRLRPGGVKSLTARERANWLQDAACTVLKRIGMTVTAEGDPPLHGLVVSNHLSYLDVLAYASIAPCLFVAKQDVRAWPVFGAFATMAGTIYVNRERASANGDAVALMEEALAACVPVVLFPEGTSSDGGSVLRFHSRYFEPAVRMHAPVTAAAIGYASSTAEEATLAYHGDDVFGTHLVRTLGQRNLEARVIFAPTGKHYADRKQAARATQTEVEMLRGMFAGYSAVRPPADVFRLTRAG